MITCFLSLGKHPKSRKAMPSKLDIKAALVAKKIASVLHSEVTFLHVGNDEQTLREYHAYNIDKIFMLASDSWRWGIKKFLQDTPSNILVFGQRAYGGEDTGLLPYEVAQDMGYAVRSNILDVKDQTMLQFLPSGCRRQLPLHKKSVITVNINCPLTCPYIFAQKKLGRIEKVAYKGDRETKQTNPQSRSQSAKRWHVREVSSFRKKLTIKSEKQGFERMTSAIMLKDAGGKIVTQGTHKEKALQIVDALKQMNVYKIGEIKNDKNS